MNRDLPPLGVFRADRPNNDADSLPNLTPATAGVTIELVIESPRFE